VVLVGAGFVLAVVVLAVVVVVVPLSLVPLIPLVVVLGVGPLVRLLRVLVGLLVVFAVVMVVVLPLVGLMTALFPMVRVVSWLAVRRMTCSVLVVATVRFANLLKRSLFCKVLAHIIKRFVSAEPFVRAVSLGVLARTVGAVNGKTVAAVLSLGLFGVEVDLL